MSVVEETHSKIDKLTRLRSRPRRSIGFENSVILEAGHVYGHQPVDPDLMRTWVSVAERVADQLQQEGLKVRRCLFADDRELFNEHDPRDAWRAQLFNDRVMSQVAYDYGFVPDSDLILQESHFIAPALRLYRNIIDRVQRMESSVIRLNQDRSAIIIGSGRNRKRIKLKGHQANDFSCEVYDLAVYCRKLKEAGIAVTVLPESYQKQQKRVAQLMRIIGVRPDIVTVYFNNVGEVTRVSAWGENARQLASALC